jgi:hypothetical protein
VPETPYLRTILKDDKSRLTEMNSTCGPETEKHIDNHHFAFSYEPSMKILTNDQKYNDPDEKSDSQNNEARMKDLEFREFDWEVAKTNAHANTKFQIHKND